MLDIETTQGLCRIVQSPEDLPSGAIGAKTVYLDFETQSYDPKRGGNLPYSGDRIGGIAITWDDEEAGYYIPIRHTTPGLQWPNVDIEPVIEWMRQIHDSGPTWVNHNVKFDAHFLAQDGIIWDHRMVCTLTAAKMLDSDRFGFGLKKLQVDWLGLDVEEVDEFAAWRKGHKTKNYCDAPADICGEYAVTDVLTNRMLWKYELKHFPEDMLPLLDTEVKLTSVLFDAERDGMATDETQLRVEKLKSLKILIENAEKLEEATGLPYTDSAKHNFEVICNQLQLPVLSWNVSKKTGEVSGPSFDKEAMAMYTIHPDVVADPLKKNIIDWIIAYRTEKVYQGFFVDPYLKLRDEKGWLHSDYNQIVRTGRMSCSHPNAQQLSPRARALVHPREGEAFLSFDASQVEFRLMVHYIRDTEAISAYLNDPTTDFHQWVADICRIARSPAKNVNFAMGYGAGKKRVVSMLKNNPSVMKEVGEIVAKKVAAGEVPVGESDREYRRLCAERSDEIYQTYHDRLPGLKTTAAGASKAARRRGYVFNAYKRRRHLPRHRAHTAFNAVVQGCAMDIIKERMIALSPRFNRKMREWGIRIVANVHDEILFAGPIAIMRDPKVHAYILEMLETPNVAFRIPITWDAGYSEKDWYEAAKEEETSFFIHPDGTATGGRLPIERTWVPRIAA
jgi:DNA polymerase I-like protein with 3'-5' exonuclease and polymerase domains